MTGVGFLGYVIAWIVIPEEAEGSAVPVGQQVSS